MDILKRDVSSYNPYSDQLVITIISRYKCARCKKTFNRTKSVKVDPKSDVSISKGLYEVSQILSELNANRFMQVHFCNHDNTKDGRFNSVYDVCDYIWYKIENDETVQVGPAEYLGSNIVKDFKSTTTSNTVDSTRMQDPLMQYNEYLVTPKTAEARHKVEESKEKNMTMLNGNGYGASPLVNPTQGFIYNPNVAADAPTIGAVMGDKQK